MGQVQSTVVVIEILTGKKKSMLAVVMYKLQILQHILHEVVNDCLWDHRMLSMLFTLYVS